MESLESAIYLQTKTLTCKVTLLFLREITGVSAPKIKIPYVFAYTTAFLLERVLGLGFPNYSTLDMSIP